MSTSEPFTSPYQLVIGGERTAAADGATFDVADPSTGERLATVATASPVDVSAAVA